MKAFYLIVFSLISISCQNNFSSFYPYRQPEFSHDSINTGTPSQVGMDSLKLSKIIHQIYANKYDQVHSILIYKDGLLVFEEYMEGNKYDYFGPYHYGERIQWEKDSLHVIMSCSKSITSACIGIAIQKGFIKSVHDPIFDYLPDHQQFKKDGKENITIEHLLTMSSGLQWNEWVAHGTTKNDIDRIYIEYQNDPLKGVLEKPLVNKPGNKFTYNGGGTIILGEILKNATGMNLIMFSDKYLFKPLGIDTIVWSQFENGVIACDGSIKLTPRDMLKIGITYLNGGIYNEQQIVSKEWVQKSKENYGNNNGIRVPISDFGRMGYSYSWWTDKLNSPKGKVNMYTASGWGGQKIIVIDDLNMVVVFTGGNYVVKIHYQEILEKYILPAIY